MKRKYSSPCADSVEISTKDIITLSLGEIFGNIFGVDDAYASGKDLGLGLGEDE